MNGANEDGRRQPVSSLCWIDGKITPLEEAVLPLNDLAFTRGYAAFEALRTYQGVPFLLEEHIARLEQTCAELYLNLPLDRGALIDAIRRTRELAGLPDCLIRIFVTGGGATGFVPEHCERIVITVGPLPIPPARQYAEGIRLATTRVQRVLPHVKSSAYVGAIRETVRLRREGFDEVVFLGEDSRLLEGSTFNLFVIKQGLVITPERDVLAGITREFVLRLVSEIGLPHERRDLLTSELGHVEEAFITSTTREIVPVASIDQQVIGAGLPGPLSRRLLDLYRDQAMTMCAQRREQSAPLEN